ncbi:ATP synthase subunit I [Paenibacillus yanchengensis]|uniref:ATP synthase subunit I n=1 Tax=Paenibacillus yanchengensis TaxID=2035833 RepID=A0ABW4YN09_9BACL
MANIASIVNVVFRVTIILLALAFMALALYPEYKQHWLGFIIGSSAGLLNVRFLARKVTQLTELVVAQTSKKFSMGFATRMCVVLLVALFAFKFEQISLWSAIVGIFVVQLLMIPVSIVLSFRQEK